MPPQQQNCCLSDEVTFVEPRLELGTAKLELFSAAKVAQLTSYPALAVVRTGLVAKPDCGVLYGRTVFDPGERKLGEFDRSPAADQCISISTSLRFAVPSSTEQRSTATTFTVQRDKICTAFGEYRFAIIYVECLAEIYRDGSNMKIG